MNDNANDRTAQGRFYLEFWTVCTVVGLGFVYSARFGFYYFRLTDLVMVLSALYFLKHVLQRRIENKVTKIALILVLFVGVRAVYEVDASFGGLGLRTLFGMSATYLTPIIFFLVRESSIDGKIGARLIVIGCIVSLLSQMGILSWGESAVSGVVDLSNLLNLSVDRLTYLDYQERTITLWRALAVGIAFAVLFVKTKWWIKLLGIIGLLLQFAGGGSGGRGALVFLVLAPVIVVLWRSDSRKRGYVRKLAIGVVVATLAAIIYVRAPLGDQYLDPDKVTNYSQTHSDRASEIFILITEGWSGVEERGGFNARTKGYMTYISNIFSDYRIFLWGVGLHRGAAFEDTANKQAHNAILDIWALSGIFGLAIFLMVQYFVLSDLRKLMKTEASSNKEKVIALSFVIAILFLYQPLLFQAVSSDRSFMIIFYLLAGSIKPISHWIQGGNHQQKLSAVTG